MKKVLSLVVVCFLLCLAALTWTSPLPPLMIFDANGVDITVSWTTVPNATGYTLYYAPYPYTGPDSIGSVDVGDLTSQSYHLWKNTAYYIAVTAYDSSGESQYSNIEYFIMGPPTPEWVDNDGDGYNLNQGDCNDKDSNTNPGTVETCGDGIDQDCSGADLACTVSSYTYNSNGTVTDSSTGLIWQQSDDGIRRDWQSSIDYCDAISLGGLSNWRLPSKEELERIIDTSYSPTIDPIFTGTNASYYWSSTPSASNPNDAWYVVFNYGYASNDDKTNYNYARCVR